MSVKCNIIYGDMQGNSYISYYVLPMPSCCGMNLVYSVNLMGSMEDRARLAEVMIRILMGGNLSGEVQNLYVQQMERYDTIFVPLKSLETFSFNPLRKATLLTDSIDSVYGPSMMYYMTKEKYGKHWQVMENAAGNPSHGYRTYVTALMFNPNLDQYRTPDWSRQEREVKYNHNNEDSDDE